MHLDHGDEETCYDCIKSGFYSSVMIDASHEPFDKNVAITKRVVDAAHAKGISVEAELGMLGGVEEDIKVEEGNACLTKPGRGAEVRQAHRLRLPRRRHRHQPRRLQVQGPPIAPLRGDRGDQEARCPASRSSCTAAPACRRRRSGGSTPPAASSAARWAWTSNEYLPAAKLGVTKINIDTDGRLVWTRVHREFFRDKPAEFDFRPPGKIFMDEYAKFIASRNDKLGSAGQIPDLRKSLGQ